ncbi:MAG: hypothetical protein IJ184_05495 [Alphaproteobacteria bacterium]|nr:hypothetical protein [Alphaproteobacteria bacterium]
MNLRHDRNDEAMKNSGIEALSNDELLTLYRFYRRHKMRNYAGYNAVCRELKQRGLYFRAIAGSILRKDD